MNSLHVNQKQNGKLKLWMRNNKFNYKTLLGVCIRNVWNFIGCPVALNHCVWLCFLFSGFQLRNAWVLGLNDELTLGKYSWKVFAVFDNNWQIWFLPRIFQHRLKNCKLLSQASKYAEWWQSIFILSTSCLRPSVDSEVHYKIQVQRWTTRINSR